MASRSSLSRSRSDGKKALLPSNSEKEMDVGNVAAGGSGEASIKQVIEGLSLSKRLVRSVSHKLKKKNKGGEEEEEGGSERRISSGCLCLYAKGGGCKVGADTTDELGDGNYGRRKSSAGEECMGYRSIPGLEESRLDCFSYGMAERLWWKNNRKVKEIGQGAPSESPPQFSLPDEVIEMCLARVPLTTIMNARLVCKTWRALTMSPHFMQIRQEGSYQSPWLFVFGIVKDEFCDGQIHALDVSLDQWHRIGVVDMLKGRFLFSVASVGNEIYVVGGCTSLSNFGKVDKSSFKTHKSVVVFSPLTGSSRLVSSMKLARSAPILGVFEIGSCSLTVQTWQSCQDQRFPRPRVRGVSDVYEDPHMFSLRRQLRDAFHESDSSLEVRRKSFKLVKQDKKQHDDKNCRRFVLIAVGGKGSRDEHLDTAEIYDPVSNKWSEIARLPGDFGVVCSGVVCNGKFYVTSETNKLAAYDLERGVWIGIEIAHSPPRLYEYPPRLVSCNDHLFMLCVVWCERGEEVRRTLQAVRKMWELDLSLLSWSEVSRHPDAPMDRNAVFVADRGKIFGVEMFKIFGQVIDFHTVCDVSKSSEMKWSRISGKHVAHEFDASSCKTKSMVVLHL